MELNPNHPAVMQAHEHWHKLCAILMFGQGLTEFEITVDLIERLGDNEKAIIIDNRGGRCVLRLVTMEEGERMAREEGGLPV